MTRQDTGNRLMWTLFSALAGALSLIAMFMLNSSASRSQLIQAKVGEHGERITKTESQISAHDSRLADLAARLSAAEQKIDRLKNPPPWERRRP